MQQTSGRPDMYGVMKTPCIIRVDVHVFAAELEMNDQPYTGSISQVVKLQLLDNWRPEA